MHNSGKHDKKFSKQVAGKEAKASETPFAFTFEHGLCGIFLEIEQSTARKGLLVDKISFKRTTEPYAFRMLQLSFFNVQTTSYFLDENRGSETFSFCCHLYSTRFILILRPNTKTRYESIFLVSCLFVCL